MDILKLISVLADYLAEYIDAFIDTLARPSRRFRPLINSESEASLVHVPGSSTPRAQINPRLISFSVLSILIGGCLHSFVIDVSKPGPLFTRVVLVLSIWAFVGVVLHGACRILGGTGGVTDTLSAYLQISSPIYVIAAFLTLLWAHAVRQLSYFVSGIPPADNLFVSIVLEPIYFCFLVQGIMSAVYVPFALHAVHRFKVMDSVSAWLSSNLGNNVGVVFLGIVIAIIAALAAVLMSLYKSLVFNDFGVVPSI